MAQGKTYRVPGTEQPSYINKEMFIGMLAGIAIPIGGMIFGPLLVAAGTFGGAYIGRKRMEDELTNGKDVKPPTLKNKDALLGGLIAGFPGALLAGAALMIGPWALIEAVEAGYLASLAASSTGMMAASAALGMLTGGLVLAACIGAGALIGGYIGKKHMAKEYAQAQANDPELNPALAKAQGKDRAVSRQPDLTPVAAHSTAAEPEQTTHRDRITAERARINGLSPRIV